MMQLGTARSGFVGVSGQVRVRIGAWWGSAEYASANAGNGIGSTGDCDM
jgi:hypothetical protein